MVKRGTSYVFSCDGEERQIPTPVTKDSMACPHCHGATNTPCPAGEYSFEPQFASGFFGCVRNCKLTVSCDSPPSTPPPSVPPGPPRTLGGSAFGATSGDASTFGNSSDVSPGAAGLSPIALTILIFALVASLLLIAFASVLCIRRRTGSAADAAVASIRVRPSPLQETFS